LFAIDRDEQGEAPERERDTLRRRVYRERILGCIFFAGNRNRNTMILAGRSQRAPDGKRSLPPRIGEIEGIRFEDRDCETLLEA
jgi:hypothetical protein